MAKAKQGDKVRVHYTGKLEDGSIFDSSVERDPLEFTIGSGNLIPGFEEGVLDMDTGDKKSITIPAEQAYGPYRDEMVVEVDRKQFPADIEPEVGQQLKLSQMDGSTCIVMVKKITESSITLDANHPLAGKTLNFEIELIEII
jgi:peptidylprolyl isomerase